MVKVKEYVLTEDIEITYFVKGGYAPREPIQLTAGMFVKPIDYRYVPKHVKEDVKWTFFDKTNEVFCYTSKGMLPINWKYIRET